MNHEDNKFDFRTYVDEVLSVPGIFQITCLPTGKVYFGEAFSPYYYVVDFLTSCEFGECPNLEFGKDLKKYGREKFKVEFLVHSYELTNPEKRLEALENSKKTWSGELY